MAKTKRVLSLFVVALMTVFTVLSYVPAKAATTPKLAFVTKTAATYTQDQTISFSVKAANYTGKVMYRVMLSSGKNYINIWNTPKTGYYYTKWTPTGTTTFPIHWLASQLKPGFYSMTVLVKRVGSKLPYDSYVNTASFEVKGSEAISSIADVTAVVAQGETYTLPATVKATMTDGTTADKAVVWTPATVDTTKAGDQKFVGKVDGWANDVNLTLTVKEVPLTVDSVSAITTNLNNPISDTYKDMVFNGTLAQVLVKAVDKNMKPVANVPIVFAVTKGSAKFVQPVAYTNNEGVAIGFADSAAKITNAPSLLEYTASVVGKNVTPVQGKVRFAQLSVGTAEVTAPVDEDDNVLLNPSLNAVAGTYTTPMYTQNMNGAYTQYVASERVSATGTTTNAVSFAVMPSMVYYSDSTTGVSGTYSKTIGWKSGAYHPYDTLTSPTIEIPAGLKYATIYLKNLQLDEHAKLYVNFYNSLGVLINSVTVNGTINDTNRGIQVPQSVLAGYATAKVVVKTAGEVNTSLNGGVEVDRVEGVYKTNVVDGTLATVTIPNAKITWSAADVVYSETKSMDATTAANYGIVVNNAVKYTYKVPVFPYTGDAVVTVYDINNKVLAYYLIPTANSDNTNVLISYNSVQAILASADEVANKVGTLTQNTDGTSVTVNSEKVGTSLLKGAIEIPGVSNDVLDATNATVYTSVNWAPLPKAASATAANTNLFALLGQKVNVTAQLTDVNGNAATVQGQNVTLSYTNDENNVGISGLKTATTDTLGQAHWTLSASQLAYVKDLTATNSSYDVELTVGTVKVTKADLYWISAQLQHQISLDDVNTYTSANPPAAGLIKYNAGNSIEFGFTAKGLVLAGKPVTAVTLSGIPIDYTKVSGTVGGAQKGANANTFVANSDRAGLELVDSKIGTIDNNNITVTYTIGGVTVSGAFVGTGATSIYDKFRMPITWTAQGAQFNFVVPNGNIAATGTNVSVYGKLTDSLGNALSGKTINVTVDNGTTAPYTTDANGIVTIPVASQAAGIQTNIKAEYNGDAQYYSINWVNATRDFKVVSAGVNSTGTNDVITLTFSNDINPNSVVARQFTITDTTNGNTVYAIKDVTVEGNTVKLTLADSNAHFRNTTKATINVSYNAFTEFAGDNAGVTFNMVDIDGKQATNNDAVTFETPSNVSVKTVSLNATTLHVEFFNAATLPVYAVDSNGIVYTATLANGAADITVTDALSYTVYCNGVSYTLFK